jgi:hypothetical protein
MKNKHSYNKQVRCKYEKATKIEVADERHPLSIVTIGVGTIGTKTNSINGTIESKQFISFDLGSMLT